MKKEFNLSEKRKELFKEVCEQFARYKFSGDDLTAEQRVDIVLELVQKQDKEFIKLFRDVMREIYFGNKGNKEMLKVLVVLNDELNKLAGDKLIK